MEIRITDLPPSTHRIAVIKIGSTGKDAGKKKIKTLIYSWEEIWKFLNRLKHVVPHDRTPKSVYVCLCIYIILTHTHL